MNKRTQKPFRDFFAFDTQCSLVRFLAKWEASNVNLQLRQRRAISYRQQRMVASVGLQRGGTSLVSWTSAVARSHVRITRQLSQDGFLPIAAIRKSMNTRTFGESTLDFG